MALSSVTCWCPPWTGHVGVVAAHPASSPPPCYHLPLLTARCAALQAGKHGSVSCPGLQGAGWTPQLLATWTYGMAGAQWDCDLGLSEGTLERQFTNSCYPMEIPARGISKIPSLSKAEASLS